MTNKILRDITSFELGLDFSKDKIFVENLYLDEPYPIFEHSIYHVLSYLRFGNKLFAIEGKFGKAVLVVNNKNKVAAIFTPRVVDFTEFEKLTKQVKQKFEQNQVRVQNVSESWLNNFSKSSIKNLSVKVELRSKEEVVYDVNLLCNLSGKSFEKIRQSKNKLLKGRLLKFEKVTNNNLAKVIEVLEKWQKTQGYKYTKNKYEKEKFTLSCLADLATKDENLIFEIGTIQDRPLSIGIFYQLLAQKKWGTIYFIKGINRKIDGGIHGISDATYCHCFQLAQDRGIKFLNDGELGSEAGTRSHKLGFKPVLYLKSFDILF